jgi:hypothetical protein
MAKEALNAYSIPSRMDYTDKVIILFQWFLKNRPVNFNTLLPLQDGAREHFFKKWPVLHLQIYSPLFVECARWRFAKRSQG